MLCYVGCGQGMVYLDYRDIFRELRSCDYPCSAVNGGCPELVVEF